MVTRSRGRRRIRAAVQPSESGHDHEGGRQSDRMPARSLIACRIGRRGTSHPGPESTEGQASPQPQEAVQRACAAVSWGWSRGAATLRKLTPRGDLRSAKRHRSRPGHSPSHRRRPPAGRTDSAGAVSHGTRPAVAGCRSARGRQVGHLHRSIHDVVGEPVADGGDVLGVGEDDVGARIAGDAIAFDHISLAARDARYRSRIHPRPGRVNRPRCCRKRGCRRPCCARCGVKAS